MSQSKLKNVLCFTDADLAANRAGMVSPPQIAHLKKEISHVSRYGAWLLVIAVVLAIAAAIVYSNSEFKKPPVGYVSALPTAVLVLGAFAAVGFAAGFLLILTNSLRKKAFDGPLEVKVATGKTERFAPGVDEYAYNVRVGEVEFFVDEKTYDAFSGDSYRVYFLDSWAILSAEDTSES